MRQSQYTTRRLVAALTFVAALVAVGFASPRAAFASITINGNICGFSQSFSGAGANFNLSGITGSLVTITVTASAPTNSGGLSDGVNNLFSFSNVVSQVSTITLPDSQTGYPGVYYLGFGAITGSSITLSMSCGGANAVISGDNRLNNSGDQGAQSVATYCNNDGSLNLIPLQLLNPGPGATSIKDAKGNSVIVKTAPLSSIAVNTTAKYDYGISVTAWSDGSWTIYRLELTGTGKTYAARVFPGQCPQVKS